MARTTGTGSPCGRVFPRACRSFPLRSKRRVSRLPRIPVAADAIGRRSMTKSFLLAAGIFACILGVEMLVVDSAVLVPLDGAGGERTFQAPDGAPGTLLSVGAATILHFCQAPRMSHSLPQSQGTNFGRPR